MNYKDMPFFSVVIPTYNRADLLPRCIESVLNQSFSDYEIVIVDNYSEDGTVEIVEKYINEGANITYIQEHNSGIIAHSRNVGIKAAKGEYIAFLDSDDWFSNNKLQVVYEECSKASYDVLFSKFQIMTKKGPGKLYGKPLTWDDPFLELLINSNTICNTTTVIKKKAWEDVGLLSEDPKLQAVEDADGLLKLASTKHTFHFINESLVYYWIGNNESYSPKQIVRVNALYEKWLPMIDVDKQNVAIGARDYLCGRIYHKIGDFRNARTCYEKVINNSQSRKKINSYFLFLTTFFKVVI